MESNIEKCDDDNDIDNVDNDDCDKYINRKRHNIDIVDSH